MRRIAAVAAVFAVPVALYAMSDLGQMAGDAEFRSVAEKAHAALMPVMNYLWPLDLATAALCVARPGALPRAAMVRDAVAGRVGDRGAAGRCFLALPTAFKGTFDLDTRFIVMAAFVVPGRAGAGRAATPRRLGDRIGFLLLFSARMTVVMVVWHDWATISRRSAL